MKLQTQIPLKQERHNLIDYHSNLLLLGSCFSENIGAKFDYFKFQHQVNPFGVLFHPKAIETLIENAINKKEYSEEDIFFYNEQWHCYDAHSKLSNTSKDDLLKDLNTAVQSVHQQIAKASHVVITLGTAWVYTFMETNKVVANCHKVPQKAFSKTLCSVSEISASLKNIVSKIRAVNTKVSVIFTVSPVRHIKDGFVENTLSKSHLIAAIHELIQVESNCKYFPSYEIMLDELRDYRFYKEDMLHPSKLAVDYIWSKFQYVWISSEANKTAQEVDAIQKGLSHKPFNSNSKAHLQFVAKLQDKIHEIQKKHSFVSF